MLNSISIKHNVFFYSPIVHHLQILGQVHLCGIWKVTKTLYLLRIKPQSLLGGPWSVRLNRSKSIRIIPRAWLLLLSIRWMDPRYHRRAIDELRVALHSCCKARPCRWHLIVNILCNIPFIQFLGSPFWFNYLLHLNLYNLWVHRFKLFKWFRELYANLRIWFWLIRFIYSALLISNYFSKLLDDHIFIQVSWTKLRRQVLVLHLLEVVDHVLDLFVHFILFRGVILKFRVQNIFLLLWHELVGDEIPLRLR